MSGADIGIILAYSAGVMFIFMLAWLLVKPFQFIGKIILNSILGGVLIIVFNFFGQYTGVNIGLNFVTALTIGILGIPGFIAILIIKLIL